MKYKLFRIRSINTRIVLYFSLLITAIIAFILVGTSVVFTSRFMEQKNNLVLEKMSLITQDIDDNINAYRNLASAVKRDTVVKMYLEEFTQNDYESLEKRLETLMRYTYGVERITLVDASLNILDRYYGIEDFKELFLDLTGIAIGSEAGREEFFSAPHNFPSPGSQQDYMENRKISYTAIVRGDDFKIKGYIVFNTGRNYLFTGKQGYAQSLFDTTYIVSKAGDVIYRFGKGSKELEAQAVQFANAGYFGANMKSNAQNTFFKQQIFSYPEWVVVGITSDANLKKDLNAIYATIIAMGVLGLAIVVVISRAISNKITRPIYSIKQAMGRFEQGEMPDKLTPTTEDELGYLVNGFNLMVDDINRFVNEIFHEQEEKEKAEVAALKFQLESLQSQINPHFLYNTLNTVSYLSLKNRTSEIRELIQALNTLLRSTLSNQDELITIQKEVYFLESYVKIQNYRYEDMIEFACATDESVLGGLIPKLILQPIVENSLLHGIYPKGTGGKIQVSITAAGGNIKISVRDNGVGIDPDRLKTIAHNAKGFNRVGIQNVDERLMLYYGDSARLHFESVVGEGTTVTFTIPKRTE